MPVGTVVWSYLYYTTLEYIITGKDECALIKFSVSMRYHAICEHKDCYYEYENGVIRVSLSLRVQENPYHSDGGLLKNETGRSSASRRVRKEEFSGGMR